MTRTEGKHLGSLTMTAALIASTRAYFYDSTDLNMKAMQACEAALQEMLKPYYLKETTHGEV